MNKLCIEKVGTIQVLIASRLRNPLVGKATGKNTVAMYQPEQVAEAYTKEIQEIVESECKCYQHRNQLL